MCKKDLVLINLQWLIKPNETKSYMFDIYV